MVCIYHIFFIHSHADGHLGWFHISAITNDAAMNMGLQKCLQDPDFIPLDIYPEMGLLGRMVKIKL